jgi:hypothetical protein
MSGPEQPLDAPPMDRTTELPRAVKVLLAIAAIIVGIVLLLDLVAILGHL